MTGEGRPVEQLLLGESGVDVSMVGALEGQDGSLFLFANVMVSDWHTSGWGRILRMTEEGDILNQWSIGNLAGWSVVSSACLTADGGCLAVGRIYYEQPLAPDIWFMKIGGDGRKEWARTFQLAEGWSPALTVHDVCETNDGYFIALATASLYGGSRGTALAVDGQGDFLWAVRTSGIGILPWGVGATLIAHGTQYGVVAADGGMTEQWITAAGSCRCR